MTLATVNRAAYLVLHCSYETVLVGIFDFTITTVVLYVVNIQDVDLNDQEKFLYSIIVHIVSTNRNIAYH